jgi:hypothetical protein
LSCIRQRNDRGSDLVQIEGAPFNHDIFYVAGILASSLPLSGAPAGKVDIQRR